MAFLLISTIAGAAEARWTFDGDIHNNSLAVSPDEKTAVASYSERSDVVVYDLAAGKVRKVMKGYVTPVMHFSLRTVRPYFFLTAVSA